MKNLFLVIIVLFAFAPVTGQDVKELKKIDGTTLYVRTMGQGEPLVVVHDGPGLNQSYLISHLEDLSKKHKLVFYDQRASGKSAIPSTDSISLNFLGDDLEGIRMMLGVEKISILTHGWGALQAVNYGIRYPGKIKKLILCNAVPLSKSFEDEAMSNHKKAASFKDTIDRSLIRGSRDFKAANPTAFKKLVLLSFRNSFYNAKNYPKLEIEMPANYLVEKSALESGLQKDFAAYDFYDAIKAFSFPTMVLHADADVTPLAASEKILHSVPGSTLIHFSRSGHFIFIEEPGKFKKMVNGFLENH